MILIFGGTTEGRKAVKVCDQAGTPFYYATKGNQQMIESAHSIHLTGGMDDKQIIKFCQEKAIQLIIDAAHPFAENLHQNIANVSKETNIPVVRLERQYPKSYKNALWFDNYDEATEYLLRTNKNNILALTGVNTIEKLKKLWQNTFCWFRILDRNESREVASANGFPKEQILYYHKDEDESRLFKRLKPDAIVTKESGESGGFTKKLSAARELNIPFLVIKRPKLSEHFINVYGEHGLRKEIDRLTDGFFKLKTGFTTGTCATAATKAALLAYFTKENQEKVSITLPNGEWVFIPISKIEVHEDEASATVIKDAGDDPDVTNGTRIQSTIKLNPNHKGVTFLQGEGVGRVTLPGVGLPIGAPAINKTPQTMMKREVFKVLRHHQEKIPNRKLSIGIDVTISVPDGKELATKTFNPKIGIVDGISIIGTSGVVKPFSSEAFVAAIHREMQVAKALGATHIVINSGAKSEAYIKSHYPDLPSQSFIHYGNFIGKTIKVADKIGIKKLSLGIMIGKAVKLAEGFLDTHSKKVVMNKKFITSLAKEANASEEVIEKIATMNMARELWDIIPERTNKFYQELLRKCQEVCQPLFQTGTLEVLLIDNSGNIIEITDNKIS
ncbi:cobalt-precorrin-5B (C1)-methyltransferase [Balneicella halophila]|uniref:Cobalt-precorrin-5B C(1)-methyltransferase n=1 Tax=Balneicella halophila TaxID=1537566 RepID=A0A7L4UQY5_BALHA|nr:cobalt-precorrin-5B (C(1))-methyltransferase CbiD [Balneicella halophila]PVX52160.1 cobalt-precorrin-5B (C1)-methyltransferase [Balneicella halophila]